MWTQFKIRLILDGVVKGKCEKMEQYKWLENFQSFQIKCDWCFKYHQVIKISDSDICANNWLVHQELGHCMCFSAWVCCCLNCEFLK